MERIDHIHILKVGCRGLVGKVHGVVQRQVPNREGLEFGVTGLDPALILLIELAEADCHLSAARPRGGHHDKGLGGLDIVVPSETLIRIDQRDIIGIVLDRVMVVDLDAHILQTLPVSLGAGLAVEMGDYHAVDLKIPIQELVPET